MAAAQSAPSVSITLPQLGHLLATVLNKKEFSAFTLQVNETGLLGFSLDDSHTLYCEFEVPSSLLDRGDDARWGPVTVSTESLESVIGPASTRLSETDSVLSLSPIQGGLKVEFKVRGALTRTKIVQDLETDRPRRLNLRQLDDSAKATPSDPRLLSLAGASYVEGAPVRVKVQDGVLEFGPGPGDTLSFVVSSMGSATTVVLDRAFRLINAFVQVRDPPVISFRVVDQGVLAFEAAFDFGATVRYVLTRVVEEE